MTSEFIATLQRVENVSHLLSKMGESTVDEAVQRIESICAFMERYGDLGEIFEHFKELESKLFMCREMLTVEEAAEYIGVSKSQIYLMTSNREIPISSPVASSSISSVRNSMTCFAAMSSTPNMR